MTHRVPVLIGVLLGALLLPPAAGSSSLPKAPVIKSISPKDLKIGETLTIKGKNFLPGKFKNTVAFQKPRAQAVFLKADKATKTTIKIRLTSKLLPFLSQKGGTAQPTLFSIRVLAKRFGAAFTPKSLSPTIAPGQGVAPAASPDCDHDGVPNTQETDDDNDLLSDATEIKYKTDPCNPDTDGDGMEDGWEYYSALDLNSKAVPYPGKRPFPNPLDATDAHVDHDGDWLDQLEEYSAWARYGGHKLGATGDLLYSDGTQNSDGGPKPVPSDQPWLDMDGDGWLSDDERDVDSDGLNNFNESVHGPMTFAWWQTFFPNERPFRTEYPGVDWLDPDSDGDTIPDGADDQDHDDISNLQETIGARTGTPLYGLRPHDWWIQPYNPCLPNPRSRVCPKHFPVAAESFPPYDGSVAQPFPALPHPGDSDPALWWPEDGPGAPDSGS
jgi:IPT/TIG domain-containing protein